MTTNANTFPALFSPAPGLRSERPAVAPPPEHSAVDDDVWNEELTARQQWMAAFSFCPYF